MALADRTALLDVEPLIDRVREYDPGVNAELLRQAGAIQVAREYVCIRHEVLSGCN